MSIALTRPRSAARHATVKKAQPWHNEFWEQGFTYPDGRRWAPDKDADAWEMRLGLRALGFVARTATIFHKSKQLRTLGTPQTSLERLYVSIDNGLFQRAIEKTAAAQFEQWKQDWTEQNGGPVKQGRRTVRRPPHIRITTDEAWIRKHGTNLVDMANSSFRGLPDDLHDEAVLGTRTAFRIVDEHGPKLKLTDPATRVEVGTEMHDSWTAWSIASGRQIPGELQPSFVDLTPAEQAKDIHQVAIAQDTIKHTAGMRGVVHRTLGLYSLQHTLED